MRCFDAGEDRSKLKLEVKEKREEETSAPAELAACVHIYIDPAKLGSESEIRLPKP